LPYLSGFSPRVHSDISRWNDPMPGIVEHWQLAKKCSRFVKHKLTAIFKTRSETLSS
jgi:hypothetical protein